MTASDKFITKYGSSDLPYVTEITAALRDGSARVSHVPDEVPSGSAAELLHTYELRSKHLARFSTPHAVQLHGDVEAFCARLRQKPSERCVGWGIEREPHFIYWLWEWSSDGSFVGATKTIDDRKISDAERITLWGEKRNP
jgi:hypothetical protein